MVLFLLSCDVGEITLTCGPRAVKSPDFYAHAISTGEFTIRSVVVDGDCLLMNVSVSNACDVADVGFDLIGSGTVSDPDSPERSLRLVATVGTTCTSSQNRVVRFDIRNLRTQGNQVRLNIQGYVDAVVYAY